jgi:hypothetical protein
VFIDLLSKSGWVLTRVPGLGQITWQILLTKKMRSLDAWSELTFFPAVAAASVCILLLLVDLS